MLLTKNKVLFWEQIKNLAELNLPSTSYKHLLLPHDISDYCWLTTSNPQNTIKGTICMIMKRMWKLANTSPSANSSKTTRWFRWHVCKTGELREDAVPASYYTYLFSFIIAFHLLFFGFISCKLSAPDALHKLQREVMLYEALLFHWSLYFSS